MLCRTYCSAGKRWKGCESQRKPWLKLSLNGGVQNPERIKQHRENETTQSITLDFRRDTFGLLEKLLDNTRRYRVGFLGCPAPGRELDSVILVGPFQLREFYDSCRRKKSAQMSFKVAFKQHLPKAQQQHILLCGSSNKHMAGGQQRAST